MSVLMRFSHPCPNCQGHRPQFQSVDVLVMPRPRRTKHFSPLPPRRGNLCRHWHGTLGAREGLDDSSPMALAQSQVSD
eukprot:109747-Amphidinium_carterae.2